MPSINRTAVIVRVKEPFAQWVNTAVPDDKDGHKFTLEEINREPHVYLVPDYEDPRQTAAWVKQNWEILFEEALEGWCTDEEFWPKGRSFKMFQDWMAWEEASIVEDTLDEPPQWHEWDVD